MTRELVCAVCGAPFTPTSGPGRPRRFCARCGRDKAAMARLWRAENAAAVATYRAARHVDHQARPCAYCGEDFVPARSFALFCGARCWRRADRVRDGRPVRQLPAPGTPLYAELLSRREAE